MNETIELLAMGLAVAAALGAFVLSLRWIVRHRMLRQAERIARSLATDQARGQMTRELSGRLERYRLSRVRAKLGASNALGKAAAELVQEYRIARLDSR